MNSNGIDARNFDGACRDLSRRVESSAMAALLNHGYIGIDARADAPNTFAELVKAHSLARKFFPVWNGASDSTIYARPLTNLMFRAWHDLTHLSLNADFHVTSELHVARHQSEQIPDGLLREIFLADTVGQAEFADATGGDFVVNQKQFVFDYLNEGCSQAIYLHRRKQALAA